jgi:hypothetical protein
MGEPQGPLLGDPDDGFGPGPGVELHPPNGCCTSFTGYSKFEIAGLEPAKSRYTTLCII